MDSYTDPTRGSGFAMVAAYVDGEPAGQTWGWTVGPDAALRASWIVASSSMRTGHGRSGCRKSWCARSSPDAAWHGHCTTSCCAVVLSSERARRAGQRSRVRGLPEVGLVAGRHPDTELAGRADVRCPDQGSRYWPLNIDGSRTAAIEDHTHRSPFLPSAAHLAVAVAATPPSHSALVVTQDAVGRALVPLVFRGNKRLDPVADASSA